MTFLTWLWSNLVELTSVYLNLSQSRLSYRIIISEEILRIDIREYIVVNRINEFSLSVEIFATFVKNPTNEKIENRVHIKVNF
jgi:hypothetical protein